MTRNKYIGVLTIALIIAITLIILRARVPATKNTQPIITPITTETPLPVESTESEQQEDTPQETHESAPPKPQTVTTTTPKTPTTVQQKPPTPKQPTLVRGYCPSSTDTALTMKALSPTISIGDYVPPDLVAIRGVIPVKDNRALCMTRAATTALIPLIQDAKKEGLDIVVTSGFRDYDTQSNLYYGYMKEHGGIIPPRIAPPGSSEHQLGTTMDITSPDINYASAVVEFGDTDEGVWMRENSWKYGFIMSYPTPGSETITGYLWEPWHFRYVGIDTAREVRESGKYLFEYLHEREK